MVLRSPLLEYPDLVALLRQLLFQGLDSTAELADLGGVRPPANLPQPLLGALPLARLGEKLSLEGLQLGT